MTPERFLYSSLRILDDGNFAGWLALCSKDIRYMVMTAENIRQKHVVGLINDDYARLQGRIGSIEKFWHAELPRTRTLHMVSNVECDFHDKDTVSMNSCFLITAIRREREIRLSGHYRDSLSKVNGGWLLTSRLAILDKSRFEGKVTFII